MRTPLLSILGERGELTTAELAEITKRSPRSVHAQLGQLAKAGHVVCAGDVPSIKGNGRPRKVWRLAW